jgi:hypothetical protein
MSRVVLAAFTASASFVCLTAIAEASCPVINGKYRMLGEKETTTLTKLTRQDAGVTSYSLDSKDNFLVADGTWRPIQIGARRGAGRIVCGSGTLFEEAREDGSAVIWWRRITVMSGDKLKIESIEKRLNGVYQKE